MLTCPNCKGTKLVKDGKCLRYNKTKGIGEKIQRYLCNDCKKTTSKPIRTIKTEESKTNVNTTS